MKVDVDSSEARNIYLQAIKHTDLVKQKAFLSEACDHSAKLLERVQKLLIARGQNSNNLLNRAVCVVDRELLGLRSDNTGETDLSDLGATGTELKSTVFLNEGLNDISQSPMIGPYKLREQIGEGGMGIVYVAEQSEPIRRKVALKIIKPGMDTREVVARFEAERQALAMMSHPNIAKVLDGGTTAQGRPYFVMELVKGIPITEFCDEQKLNINERLELFIKVCQAVQHAHMKGIIHRDLKPSNVMVEMHDVSPVPKVIDFGVAKAINQRLSVHTVYTQFTQLIGTPLYMSPEQAQQSSIDIDTRSDIYSLGVLLYELLTGKTPFDKESLNHADINEMRRMICEQEPPRPSARVTTLDHGERSTIFDKRQVSQKQFSASMQRELDWIVMKSLEKDRNRRYESASAFAADIQRYLDDEPVEAFPPSTIYFLKKFTQRNKTTITTTCLVAGALIIGTFVSVKQAIKAHDSFLEADKQRLNAVNAQEQALQNEEFSRQLVYAADIRLAAQAWESGDISRFTNLLDRHTSAVEKTDYRGFEWWYLRQFGVAKFHDIAKDTGGSSVVRYSPDGKFLVTGQYDGTICIRNGHSFEKLASLPGHEGLLRGVDFSTDGRQLASIGDDGVIRLWDLAEQKQIRSFQAHDAHGFRVFFVMENKVLASCGEETSVRLWDATTGEPLGELKDYARTVERAAMDRSPDGRLCASGDPDGFAYVWDTQTHEHVCKLSLGYFEGARCRACCIRFSPDGRFVAIATTRNIIRLCDAQTGEQLATFTGHEDDIQAVAFHPSGGVLASSDMAGVIRTWPLHEYLDVADDDIKITEKWPPYFRGHSARIWSLDFSPDGTFLLSASKDGKVRSWQEREPESRKILGKFTTNSLAFDVTGSELILAGDYNVLAWDCKTDEQRPFRDRYKEWAYCLAVSVDNKSCITGHEEGIIRFWNIKTGRLEKTLTGHKESVDKIAFSPDGRLFASASWDGTAKLWDTVTRSEIAVFDMQRPHCYDLAFSPNGRLLACSTENEVLVYEIASRKQLYVLQGHQNSANCVAFSPDGQLLATGSDDRTIRIWDVDTGGVKHVISANRDAIESIVFSPDGRTIASGGEKGTVAFSHVETGQFLFDLKIGQGQVLCLQFSPDGKTLAAAAGDNGVTLLFTARNEPESLMLPNEFTNVSFQGRETIENSRDDQSRKH